MIWKKIAGRIALAAFASLGMVALAAFLFVRTDGVSPFRSPKDHASHL